MFFPQTAQLEPVLNYTSQYTQVEQRFMDQNFSIYHKVTNKVLSAAAFLIKSN